MELSDLLGEELLEFCAADIDIDDLVATAYLSEYESRAPPLALDLAVPGRAATEPASALSARGTSSPSPQNPFLSSVRQRFVAPKTEKEIQEARTKAVPKKTLEDTQYCVRVWQEWCDYRKQMCGDCIDLKTLQPTQLSHWLTRFVLEVRKRDGTEYPAKTLHHLCSGIMRFLRWNGLPALDLFNDPEFAEFRATLDAEMKRLQAEGVGMKTKQAEPLTEADKEILWEKGLLGDSTPRTLLDTVIFMNGLYFALRSGSEHRALRFSPPQITVVERAGERPYLEYREDVSKNRPGGLKGRNIKPKVVRHHSNIENPNRCFVRLFKLYLSRCPKEPPKDAFYLKPLTNPTSSCWYSIQPIGRNKLAQTVSRLCAAAGIEGFKTNHSLRVTNATRLYASGADEQLVMERTGHRSVDGIRTYKRTTNEQQIALSDTLNRAKKPRQDTVLPVMSAPNAEPSTAAEHQTVMGVSNKMVSASIPGHFSFNSCPNITINSLGSEFNLTAHARRPT